MNISYCDYFCCTSWTPPCLHYWSILCEVHSYIFVFPDLCLDKQTNLSAQLFILAQHVSTIRPWSRAAFYWTEFTFTSHEVKVNFVSKLDINQKSESKDPHWQSISSELFEKTPAPQGLVFPLLVLSLLTLPNQNHSPPPSLSPTILSFLCSSSVPSTFLLSCRCPPCEVVP